MASDQRHHRSDDEIKDLMVMCALAIEIHEMQIDATSYILRKHLAYATSWEEDSTRATVNMIQ